MNKIWALIPLLWGCNIETEPQTSYCEALCDRAVSCEESYRGNTGDSLYADCVAEAEASNSDCSVQSKDGVGAASSALLTECTDAIAADGECSDQTGTYDELVIGTQPASCSTQTDGLATYTAARYAAWETGDELCGRFTTSWCEQLDACLIADLGDIPEEVWEQLGDDAQGLCAASPGIASFSTSCTTDALYAREVSITDGNLARQGSRECLRELDTLSCDAVLSGDLPKTCAAAFTSTDQALGFATGLIDVADVVTAAMAEK
jgi:hypothetical protein